MGRGGAKINSGRPPVTFLKAKLSKQTELITDSNIKESLKILGSEEEYLQILLSLAVRPQFLKISPSMRKLLNLCLEAVKDENKVNSMLDCLTTYKEAKVLSANQACKWMFDTKTSQSSYQITRNVQKEANLLSIPSYKKVQAAKKDANIDKKHVVVRDNYVRADKKEVVKKTCQSIFDYVLDEEARLKLRAEKKALFVLKCGWDGSVSVP